MNDGSILQTGPVSHFIPQLALPKVFDTSVAESLLDPAPDPALYWKLMLRRLLENNWGQSQEVAA